MNKTKFRQPLVTVLIIVYNGESFIEEAVRSISNQTYKNLEILVVDDGSTDNTYSILKKLKPLDKRLRIFRSKKNLGLSIISNFGLKKAKGDYIARMDADDISFPDRIEKQVKFLMKNPQVVMVGGQCVLIDKSGRIIGEKKNPLDHNDIYNSLFYMNPLQNSTCMINRKLLPKGVFSYNEHLLIAYDLELNFKLAQYGKLANLKEFICYYRQHPDSLSSKNPKETFKVTLKIRQKAVREYQYKPTLKGKFFNLCQKIIVPLLPNKLIHPIFSLFRAKINSQNLIKSLFFPIIIFSLILLFFNKLFYPTLSVFTTPDFGQSDLVHGYYTTKHLLSESLKENKILLWSKDMANGYPIYAAGQIGTFNLVNFVLYKLFPTFWAINFSYVLTFFIIGVGTYLFARELKLNRLLSLLSSLIFTFSGFNIMQISHMSLLQAASWLPLEFYFLEKFLKRRKMNYLLFLSLIISQQIFNGHQQITVYSLFISFLYLFLRILVLREKRKEKLRRSLIVFFSFFMAIFISLGLSAILFLPSFELFQHSTRNQGVNTLQFPFPPKHLITFISPYYFGSPKQGTYPRFKQNWGIFWENTGYVGLLPMLLLPMSFFFLRKNPFLLSFSVLFFISLFLILGKFSPLYFFFSIPPFSFFRVPSRFLILTDFSLAMISALTLNQIVKRKIMNKKVIDITLVSLLFFHFTNIAYYFYNYHPTGDVNVWFKTPKTAQFLQQDENARFFTINNSQKWNDIFLSSGWPNPEAYLQFQDGLIGHSNLFYNVPKSSYILNLPTKRMALLNQILDSGFSFDKESKEMIISPHSRKILDIQSVKYILSPKENIISQFKHASQFNNYVFYENPNYLPRARMVYEYKIVETLEKMKKTLLADDFDPAREVILEKEITRKRENEKTRTKNQKLFTGRHAELVSASSQIPKQVRDDSNIEWLKDEDTEVELTVETNTDGLLVLADSYYPGWKAFVDGKETEILAANLNQRAIQVEQGSHQVKFIYQPRSFQIGAMISGITALLWGFLFVFSFLDKSPHTP